MNRFVRPLIWTAILVGSPAITVFSLWAALNLVLNLAGVQ